jgi:hypothetical protein
MGEFMKEDHVAALGVPFAGGIGQHYSREEDAAGEGNIGLAATFHFDGTVQADAGGGLIARR